MALELDITVCSFVIAFVQTEVSSVWFVITFWPCSPNYWEAVWRIVLHFLSCCYPACPDFCSRLTSQQLQYLYLCIIIAGDFLLCHVAPPSRQWVNLTNTVIVDVVAHQINVVNIMQAANFIVSILACWSEHNEGECQPVQQSRYPQALSFRKRLLSSISRI